MHKYKVVVYAISKNESKFVKRWYDSVKEADEIYVLDTGSTDNTVSLLKHYNINVFEKKIEPWRFDVARNESLKLVPLDTDICVCIDLDEVFNPGWRELLENTWSINTNRLRYTYNWSFDKNNNPSITFIYEKIHDRKNYKWIYPVHEILKFNKDNENIITNEDIILNHYPDPTKSRSSYLKLLELSLKENPNDERNLHYLGREYMYYKKWNKSIDTLLKHIKISTWNLEKSASMRFISRCYIQLNRFEEAEYWLKKAIDESPNTRDAYVELGILYSNKKEFIKSINMLIKAKAILKNEKVYVNEPFSWDNTIDDLLSINYFNIALYDEAIFYINKALEYDLNNERLLKNKELFIKYKNTFNK